MSLGWLINTYFDSIHPPLSIQVVKFYCCGFYGIPVLVSEGDAGIQPAELESSLFEAQRHLSQLEITRSQLEIQLHTVTQAKEVIQGKVKCLQCELEAERSLMRQEQENMVQQLLQTEQQYNNTLKLRQTDHEVQINKLLQDLASEWEGHHSELQKILEQWEKEKVETRGAQEEAV
ncbi:centrosome-associated protein CEP250-like [Strix aluco]|uniref:centrosome-associated protein CEP250-like n=1 Tax=Strix aluco TaxID=111821 RepID=UPI003DA566E5